VPVKRCRVSFLDQSGVQHEVEVEGESVYEAAALALLFFRKHDWSAEQSHWTGALQVAVQQPAIVHRVNIDQLHSFASSHGSSPKDIIARQKIRAILEGKSGEK
jgi:hypothetical protein